MLLLVLTIAAGIVAPMRACGGLPSGYAPIIAFELARTPADLVALFGSEPSPCRDALTSTMRRATIGDYVAYMPAYGAFLIAAFVAMRAQRRRLANVGITLAIIALVGDALENACLFAILEHPVDDTLSLARLPWATNVKWVALGVLAIVSLPAIVTRGAWGKLGATLSLLAPLGVLATIVAPQRFGPFIALGITLNWIALMAIVARDSFGKKSVAPA